MTPTLKARSYSFSEALNLTHVSKGQLARWTSAGLIVPDHGGGGTPGAHRRFSFRNLIEILLVAELVPDLGATVADVLEQLRLWDPETVGSVPGIDSESAAAYKDVLDAWLSKDSDARRWFLYSRPATRRSSVGFLIVGINPYQNDATFVANRNIHFFDRFEQLQELLTLAKAIAAESGPMPGGLNRINPIKHIVVDLGRILDHLEVAVADSLV